MRAAFENGGPDPTPPESQFETQDLSFHEAVSAARDPDVAAVALPMPIKLIMPFDVPAGVAAAADAWGISAVKANTSRVTGDGVVVAVLDTGIDKKYPAFAGVAIVEKDFSGSGNGDR
jgi:subtilisin family serine protease